MPAAKKPAKAAAKKPARVADDIVEDVLAGIRSSLGDDGAYVLGSDKMALRIRGVISTRVPTLDAAIGRGGLPLGRLSILHGGEGSGKTTLALQACAEVQSLGGLAIYVDKEFKLDPDYAEKLGVDTRRLILPQPYALEDVISVMNGVIDRAAAHRAATGKRPPMICVVDSINACIAKAALNGEVGDHHIALEARLWSRNLPAIVEKCAREDIALLFISQVRKKIGIMFGNDEDLAGGQAPRFYASLIMYVRRVGKLKVDDKNVGNKVEVECRKNQIAPPFRKGLFSVRFGRGADFETALLSAALEAGVVEQSGAFYVHAGQRLGNGIEAAAKALRRNVEMREKITGEWRSSMGWT